MCTASRGGGIDDRQADSGDADDGRANVNKRILLWSATGALYLLFALWYTNLSGPLTKVEIGRYVALLEQEGAAPERIAQVRGFLEADTGRQFIMVNLIDMADAPPQIPGAPPNATADDLLDIYMAHMYRELFKRACHPVFVGEAVFVPLDVVGIERAVAWPRTALMRYRSRRDMIEIATNPAFRERHEFKIAAFDKTVAYPVETVLYLSDARVLLFVLLLAIVATLDLAIYRGHQQAK